MMRWVLRILGGLVVLLLVAVSAVYLISSRIINERHPFVPYAITVPTDSTSIAQGQRLAQIRCMGCHGDSLQGNPAFFDEPMVARIAAPNVPARLAALSDAEFAGFLRSGVRKDGISPFIMPPPGLYHLSDADMGALIAYLRTVPVSDSTPTPKNAYRLMGRLGVALGQFKTAVAMFDTTQERVGQDPAWATTRNGEYLARSICTECHGLRLTGDSVAGPAPSPSIAQAAGYSLSEFMTLVRTGTPREAGKQIPMMGEVARIMLVHLTDDEVAALHGYLQSLPLSGVK